MVIICSTIERVISTDTFYLDDKLTTWKECINSSSDSQYKQNIIAVL